MSLGDNILTLRKKKKLSRAYLAEILGVTVAQIGNYERGDNDPSKDKLSILAKTLEVTISDLYSDKDFSESTHESLVNDTRGKYGGAIRGKYGSQKNEAERIETQTMFVPLVNQYAYAGYMSGFSDSEYIEELPKVPFQVDHEGRGNYVCFEMRGESMFDGSYQSLLEGDKLLSREIQPQHWQSKLHIKKYRFVIAHKEQGIIVKYITTHDVLNNKIIVHSLNPEYEDQVLDLNDVAQIFNVIKVQRS